MSDTRALSILGYNRLVDKLEAENEDLKKRLFSALHSIPTNAHSPYCPEQNPFLAGNSACDCWMLPVINILKENK